MSWLSLDGLPLVQISISMLGFGPNEQKSAKNSDTLTFPLLAYALTVCTKSKQKAFMMTAFSVGQVKWFEVSFIQALPRILFML